MDRDEQESSRTGVHSVGRALETSMALSVRHPLYVGLVDAMEQKTAELATVRGKMRASTEPSVVTVALATNEVAELAELFPEFRLVTYGFERPAHAFFVQFRRLSVEWLMQSSSKLAEHVGVFGLPVFAAVSSRVKYTMLCDETSPVAVHERHTAVSDAYRLYSDYVALSSAIGKQLRRQDYDDFVQQRGVMVSANQSRGAAQAICVDGLLYAYSPWQVALGMVAFGASVAFGTVPYHPVMLLQDHGELPGFGVHFQHTSESVLLKYPEGVAGVSRYAQSAWRAWMTAHTFSIGTKSKTWFQLELLKQRGCAMFYRLVRLPGEPTKTDITHALEMPFEGKTYAVKAHRLKGLSYDPTLETSWDLKWYFVSARLVERVYQFAMQLERDQFTKYAIRKQVHVVNDRTVVEGTSVKVSSPLGEEMVDALVSDIFSRAFVDRYEVGTLTEEVRRYVEKYVGFSSGSLWLKVQFVAVTTALALWDVTLAPLNKATRKAADAVRRFSFNRVELTAPKFELAPSYVMASSLSNGVLVGGGLVAARELSRVAAMQSGGMFSRLATTLASLQGPTSDVKSSTFRVEMQTLFADGLAKGKEVDSLVAAVAALNPMDEASVARRSLEVATASRQLSQEKQVQFNPVADPVHVLNECYSSTLPGVAEQNLEYDSASVSLDPQDRTLAAPYMRLPGYFGEAPRPRKLYRSRLRALNVPKRQQTFQELLSSIAVRNLSAPQVALPQDDGAAARTVWEAFLDTACVPDARDRIKRFMRDPVGLEEEAFREWSSQVTPDKLEAVRKELGETFKALDQMTVSEYLVMLKADVKPTLSKKPLDTRTEPQVIVYHEKAVSALFSCMIRVLVRRFLSLLKPNYHVNLVKDTKDMEAFVRGIHVFGDTLQQFLENDFSKYDKSQAKFVFILEELVFKELGLSESFLAQWVKGHVECKLRSVAMGLSLHVMYQRKSGDATTSFGNVLLNVLSITYAYRGTEVVWLLAMGDDSLACVRSVSHLEDAVTILAEVFNLGAKTYLTRYPYFASNFVLIDDVNRTVHFVPDPVKRIERWSMSVSAEDPQWQERYVSAKDSMVNYMSVSKTALLPKLVSERYDVDQKEVLGMADALATVLKDFGSFRSVWEESHEESVY